MIRSTDPPMRFVLFTVGVLLLVAIVSAIGKLGAVPLAASVLLLYGAWVWFGVKTRDHTIWLWLLFGLATGLTQVGSNCDWWLCTHLETLIYPDNLPKIGVSPFYLPFAWALIFTQLTIIGAWILKRRDPLTASILTAVIGGVLISIFENLAHPALWWYYQETPMFIWAPYFVNIFEFLSTLGFVLAAWRIARATVLWRAYVWAIGIGFGMGIWMCVAMRFAWWLVGPCEMAAIQLTCEPVPTPAGWPPD